MAKRLSKRMKSFLFSFMVGAGMASGAALAWEGDPPPGCNEVRCCSGNYCCGTGGSDGCGVNWPWGQTR